MKSLLVAALIFLTALFAFAEDAVLVSGVSSYAKWAELRGVQSDLHAVSELFRKAGYTVELAQDVSK